ncbi:TBC1 domain family member 22A isoform X2 [Pan paniscus]|uniref:TBC1 domain family member 22A isoform X2 n=1 Tax=Pan paniscus TaxID=9597 RepID=UPI003003D7AA
MMNSFGKRLRAPLLCQVLWCVLSKPCGSSRLDACPVNTCAQTAVLGRWQSRDPGRVARPSLGGMLMSSLHRSRFRRDLAVQQEPIWLLSIQHVYGAQHPPFDPLLHGTLLRSTAKMPTTPVKAKRVSTFQEFESNTSDAWDAGEDDDELLAMAAESLNSEVVMETANRVLRNHSQRQGRPTLQEGPGLQQKPRPEAELPSPPSGDLRLVKSVSESHTSCPAESASDAAPLQRSQSLPHSATVTLGGTSDPSTLSSSALSEREASRLDKFKQLLAGPNTDLEELRRLSWSGIPKPVRPMTWKLLSGYLPANVDRRPATLQRKQKEYFAFIEHYYDSRNDEVHQDTYRQIHIDIPRMSPEALILQPKVTEIFERILFIWAIRHPASGYVQGINDLVTPFFVVFICEYIEAEEVDTVDVSGVPAEVLRNIEADTYWCMSKLLDGIQDNYTFAQPGIQMKVKMLEELVSRIDGKPASHAAPLCGRGEVALSPRWDRELSSSAGSILACSGSLMGILLRQLLVRELLLFLLIKGISSEFSTFTLQDSSECAPKAGSAHSLLSLVIVII